MSIFAQVFFVIGILWGIVATIVMLLAWRSIRSGDINSHKRAMLILLAGGWAFVAFYLVSYSLELTYSDIIPQRLVPWFAFHGVMALVALFAVTVLVWARLSEPQAKEREINSTVLF